MTFNLTMIHENAHAALDELLARLSPTEPNQFVTVDDLECKLFEQLLKFGARLMQLYVNAQAAAYPHTALTTAEGQLLRYHGERGRNIYTIFGELRVKRPYFFAKGIASASPVDAQLGLGKDSYSAMVREWHEVLSVHLPYEETAAIMQRFFKLGLSTRTLQEFVQEDAAAVERYYEHKPPPPVEEEQSVLVVQADGKGIPLVKPSAGNQKVRLQRGEARSRKKAAVVTALYTIEPAVRTPAAVLNSLLGGSDVAPVANDAAPGKRGGPLHKQLDATLQGKKVALGRLAAQVAKRDGAHILHRVALCDGDPHLQKQLLAHCPDFTLVLDFIHAYEYLWSAATCLYGQDDDAQRLAWVRTQTDLLLNSQTQSVIDTLGQLALTCKRSKRKILTKVAGYFAKNLPFMDYADYLNAGWPIASGVIEGVCRHLVKDRFELSGMRWSEPGAENLLRLRVVAENGDWDAYHTLRRQLAFQQLYGRDCPAPVASPLLAGQTHTPTQLSQPACPSANSYAALPLAA